MKVMREVAEVWPSHTPQPPTMCQAWQPGPLWAITHRNCIDLTGLLIQDSQEAFNFPPPLLLRTLSSLSRCFPGFTRKNFRKITPKKSYYYMFQKVVFENRFHIWKFTVPLMLFESAIFPPTLSSPTTIGVYLFLEHHHRRCRRRRCPYFSLLSLDPSSRIEIRTRAACCDEFWYFLISTSKMWRPVVELPSDSQLDFKFVAGRRIRTWSFQTCQMMCHARFEMIILGFIYMCGSCRYGERWWWWGSGGEHAMCVTHIPGFVPRYDLSEGQLWVANLYLCWNPPPLLCTTYIHVTSVWFMISSCVE